MGIASDDSPVTHPVVYERGVYADWNFYNAPKDAKDTLGAVDPDAEEEEMRRETAHRRLWAGVFLLLFLFVAVAAIGFGCGVYYVARHAAGL